MAPRKVCHTVPVPPLRWLGAAVRICDWSVCSPCSTTAVPWCGSAASPAARRVSAISAGMASVSDRSAINSSLGIPARPGVPAASFRRAHTQDDQAARSAAWERRCSGQYALSISRFPSTCLVTRRVRDHGRPWRLARCLWPCSGRRSEALPWQRR